ncbi:MAG: cobyrinate a,c-diamide synthase [Geobacteraceae bacterium]
MKSIIIAAPHSGSGKTIVTIGIMECLKRRGLRVAPFKVGPDFIDPGYHRMVTGRPSVNLDGWICSESFVRESFIHHAQGTDMAVIEGVMGLFDGIGGTQEAGSTAQIARITGAPVILVVDAKGQARSAAALVKGFAEFDPQVNLAGVIFNNVGSDNHCRVLKEAVESVGITVIGCIPRDEKLRIESRHLGLMTAEENPLSAAFLDHLAEVVEEHLDLDQILAAPPERGISANLSKNDLDFPLPLEGEGTKSSKSAFMPKVRVAVARDAAFCFVYEDNLRLLREAGAELVEFSPLRDEGLPGNIAGIYLPGGYPELFADALASNTAMKAAIREEIEAGLPVFAECGGFIYLTQGIGDQELTPFVGIFPVTTRMLPRRKALGYREIETVADSIIGPQGTIARGHEFHYSEMGDMPSQVERIYRVRRQGVELGGEGFRYRNCLASYIHLHFGSCPEIATAFIESCMNYLNNQPQET